MLGTLLEVPAQCFAATLPSIQDVCCSAARAVPVPGECVDDSAQEDYLAATWLWKSTSLLKVGILLI